MGILDFFKKDKGKDALSVTDLTLSDLEKGYLVDYDLKTWEVLAHNFYDWGDRDISHEWQLSGVDEVVFLEQESDDEDDWSLNRKISFARLGPDIKKQILETGDPPDEIVYDGVTYYMEETAGGHFYQDGQSPGKQMLRWSYEDDSGDRYLGIEQWGETDFEASIGQPVETYQFTNILPKE
jgi:Domain of unknown function (DUF4178)